MARVDPDDDRLLRYVVRQYRYDPERRERRHVVVAAFDSRQPEFDECFQATAEEIKLRRARGEDVDPSEDVTGAVHEPGYQRRAANGHLITRAIAHSVWMPWMDELELPSNMAISHATR